MTPDPIDAIVARLTVAQREALCQLPVNRDWTPKHTGHQWKTLACIKSLRLINGVRDGYAGKGKYALHRLTPLGLAVRELLMRGEG